MRRFLLPLVIIAPLSCVLAAGTSRVGFGAATQNVAPQTSGGGQGPIKVTITTGGGLFGPVTDHYRTGQRVPVVISMTNNGSEPVYVCDSSTLYQDRPRLLKDGRALPYLDMQKTMVQTAERDRTCENLDEPLNTIEQRLLRPGETAVEDWFILSEGKTPMGDLAWYETLQPGKYELTTRRLLGCCKGTFVESDTISFEVEP